MVVDVVDVLALQLVSVVVYLVFYVECAVHVIVHLAPCQQHVHLCKTVIGKFKHLVQVFILLFGEVFLASRLAVDGACYVVAAVADALYLCYLAHHGSDFCLGVVAQVCIAHHVQVLGNLNLHRVADILVFLNARIELAEIVLVGGGKQFSHKSEHALYAVGKRGNLFLCLQYRELGGFHNGVATDVAQAELLFSVTALGLDDAAHQFLYLRYEPYQCEGVGHVEAGVEGCQHNGQFGCQLRSGKVVIVGVIAHHGAHHIDKGIEQAEHPQHANQVEHQMRRGSSPCLCVGSQCGKVGSGGGTDVLAHDQGDAKVDGQHARGAEQDGDGHHGCRRLHDAGDDGADGKEDKDGEVALCVERAEEADDRGVVLQVQLLACRTEQHQREEQEGNTKEEVANVSLTLRVDEHDAQKERGIHHCREVNVVSQTHNPCCQCGADIGSHDHRYGLCQRHQSGIDKRHRHHGGGRRRLHCASYKHTSEHTGEAVGGHGTKDVAQLRTCHLLQRLAHHLHSVDEQRQRTNDFKEYPNRHNCLGRCGKTLITVLVFAKRHQYVAKIQKN